MKRNSHCEEGNKGNPVSPVKRYYFPALFLTFLILSVFRAGAADQQYISLNLKKASVEQALNSVKSTTRYNFSYRLEDISSVPLRNYDLQNATIQEVMGRILDGTNLEWSEKNGVIVISQRSGNQQHEKKIRIEGSVRYRNGKPCAGATVLDLASGIGATTDAAGRFRFTVPAAGRNKVRFSCIGQKTQEIEYTGNPFEVVMETEVKEIGEVIVTGIFERRKEGFTGSATVLKHDDIVALAPSNVLNALAITDPGFKMEVNNLTGSNPTAIPDYRMRGQASIDANYTTEDAMTLRGDYNTRPNQPLFVLDGIAGVSVTTIMDLDPEQVESITLLKDAAATVIYGAEAANGVVVVETRKPQSGKLRITYNGNYGISIADVSDYNLTNSAEKLLVEELGGSFYYLDQTTQTFYTYVQTQVAKGVDTDWISKPLRNAFTHRHGLNFEGGDASLRYKIYLGASFQPGVMKRTNMNTQSSRIDLQYRFGDFLLQSQTYLDFGNGSRESNYGTFDMYARMNPYDSPYDENGNIPRIIGYQNLHEELTEQKNILYNPYYNTLVNSRNDVREQEVKEALKLRYSPSRELRLELDFSMTRRNEEVEVFKPAKHTSQLENSDPKTMGTFSNRDYVMSDYRVSLTASYNKFIGDSHILSLYGRWSASENSYKDKTLVMSGFPNDNLSEIFMGTTFKGISGDENISRNMKFVATANYSYKDRYAADFSVSLDGSSQFGTNNRFAPFWSTGVRWNLHNEKFLENSGALNNLVLRASYGITGSNSFSSYQALQMYSYSGLMSTYLSSDVVGAMIYGMGNPDLKWQQTDDYNAALEFGFFDDRISGRVEAYYKLTKNTLLDYSLAPSIGVLTVKDNLGSISNRGVEASLRFVPYRNIAQNAYLNIMLTAGRNRSRIEKISDALGTRNAEVYSKDSGYDLTKPIPQYVDGQSYSAIWGMKSGGIDPVTGLEIFYTRDGQRTTTWSSENVVVIGDSEPNVSGSVSIQAGYRNLSLTVASSYTYGGDIYNRTIVDKVENANLRQNVDKRVLYERWKEPGDDARYRALFTYADTKTTSRFIMKNNEFRISSVNLSYRMSRTDHKFLRNLGLSTASVGLYLTDVLRFSNVGMERGIYYPFAHKISMSLNLSF